MNISPKDFIIFKFGGEERGGMVQEINGFSLGVTYIDDRGHEEYETIHIGQVVSKMDFCSNSGPDSQPRRIQLNTPVVVDNPYRRRKSAVIVDAEWMEIV